MKKLILTLGFIALIETSTFAQGLFIFQTGAGAVWDGWSSIFPKPDNKNYVAFLIGSGTPLINSYLAFTPTNGTEINSALAWTDVLTDPNYKLATNVAGAALIETQTSTLGTVSYNGGAGTIVSNTAAGGGTISMIAIGWSDLFGTDPFAAAAAGAPIGWSAVYSYSYAAGPTPGPAGTPGNMLGLFQFGVNVPEPTTFALFALGSASLLISRHKKS